jgi:hypothetical protein
MCYGRMYFPYGTKDYDCSEYAGKHSSGMAAEIGELQ